MFQLHICNGKIKSSIILGNEFSTVEGMVFKWNIEPTRTGTEILR